MGLLGSLIGAGSSLLGGILGGNSAAKQAKKVGTHSIQWRVEDAQKAGVNPIYALGSPVMAPMADVGSPLANGISNMGQDLGRAADAVSSQSMRLDDFTRSMQLLQLQRAGLENDVLKQQLASSKLATMRQAGGLPPRPASGDNILPGQGNSPLVKQVPQEVTSTRPGIPNTEPASIPELGFGNTGTGYAPIPSRDYADRQMDGIAQEMSWVLRNQILPSLGYDFRPP